MCIRDRDMSELIDKYGTNIKQIYGEDIAKINQVEGFVSVSYTHLDVYKRQVLY